MIFEPKKTSIFDDYKLSNVLGKGINGDVLLATRKLTNEKYAVKTLKDTPKAKQEIDLQWRACQDCPNIVKIIDVYENIIGNIKVLCVVMELMEGGELFDLIIKRNLFTEKEVAKIMRQIVNAIKHLHSMNIAHRDLKPENILLNSKDENSVLKLSDFGFAKEVNLGLTTPVYTLYYVPPEILDHKNVYDKSCDIWSLGVIMYILCCGYPPFNYCSNKQSNDEIKKQIKKGIFSFPEKEWSDVSNEAKELIKQMIQIQPDKRIKIDDIANSRWITKFDSVPGTPLNRLEENNLFDLRQNINLIIDESRSETEITNNMKINNLESADNPLYKSRIN